MAFPKNAEPRDVPWTKKMSSGYGETYYEAQSAQDWLGNRFNVGQAVLYCIGAGRGQMLALGEVLAIRYRIRHHTEYLNPETSQWSRMNGGGGAWSYTEQFYKDTSWEVRRTPYDEIEVQVHTAVTSGGWNNEKRSKPAWVNPMNITAIGPSMVDEMIKRVNDARA